MNKVLYSSKTDLWETPQHLFDDLDREFHFDLDVCATKENAKCNNYFTITDDGLSQEWKGTVWCNPPYGRKVGYWVSKALESHLKYDNTIVMLLPSRTDTKWFHDFIYGRSEIRFIRGRLKFGNSVYPAPFPSMIVIFRSKSLK